MRDNLSSATEETLGEEDEGVIDSKMIALWKKANKLTQKYKTNGRRYQTLRRIRGIFELIRQHGEDLSRAQWVSTCERLGKINGMKQLWGILRKMLGKGTGQSPLETLTLRHGTDKHEEEITKTFFPPATTMPPTPLGTPKLDSTNPDLDTQFTLGERHAAIKPAGFPSQTPNPPEAATAADLLVGRRTDRHDRWVRFWAANMKTE
ncbi:hypothetical protein HPB49_020257 [Dermacentor silvarum]|uniref:Uncharacterized protein n=1 Tax=Dermacentor silvarum TaxID=543639 RepID=A0ACB8DFS5_DERSI|nr:hypothetical protein HPB49_020257 [Dermacentor silvarum]